MTGLYASLHIPTASLVFSHVHAFARADYDRAAFFGCVAIAVQ